jgi:hypothetical protein
MKKLTSIICAIVVTIAFINCKKETPVPGANLTSEIKTYITTHFPDQIITRSTKGLEFYEVALDDLTKLKFGFNSTVIDIEALRKLPDSVIPVRILEYVSLNYPNNYIIGWELDDINQKVELDNEIDLKFNINGDFLFID